MSSISISKENPAALIVEHAAAWIANHSDTPLHLYALVEAGQDRDTWQRLQQLCTGSRALLTSEASAIADFSPHLLHLGSAMQLTPKLTETLNRNYPTAAFSLLCSSYTLTELHAHLVRFTEVKLPGNVEMLLAYWDPAILGTLVGQVDDDSLHVPGPVLTPHQLHALLKPLTAWWYCDREGRWHRVDTPEEDALHADTDAQAYVLSQAQEDALVEASVPDQVLYHIELNRPTLFDEKLPHPKRYRFVRVVLSAARKLGLEGMRDLANFVALCLIYRQRIETDPVILQLLSQVEQKAMSFDDALKLMPE